MKVISLRRVDCPGVELSTLTFMPGSFVRQEEMIEFVLTQEL